jgi:hypothetical protein
VHPSLCRAACALAAVLACVTVSTEASALDLPGPKDEPIGLDITNTTVLDYRFDNRNNNPLSFNPRTVVDDYYGEWINRLNVQATWWRFRAGVRLDSALYVLTPTHTDAQRLASEQIALARRLSPTTPTPDLATFTERFDRELNTRFVNTIYPAKLFLGYNQPGLDITVGDFYAQLGRGLVLSVRKIDELAIDTTIRGAKAVAEHDFGPVHIGATLLAGLMNPLRFDETSGRRLNGAGSPLFFGFPRARDLTTYDQSGFSGATANTTPSQPSYLEDRIIGARVEAGPSSFQLAFNGSMLDRTTYTQQYLHCIDTCGDDEACKSSCGHKYPDWVSSVGGRSHNQIRTFSGSLNVPSIKGVGDLYVEVAGQQLREGHVDEVDAKGRVVSREKDLTGYAVYANANVRAGPLSLSLEGKHYRRFFALGANIDVTTPGFSAPEYSVVAYSAPPTAEPIYVQPIEQPNVCMTGGRARADWRFDPTTSIYLWAGRYTSWSELRANNECKIQDDLRTDTWDTAVGVDVQREGGKSAVRLWSGVRIADAATIQDTTIAGPTNALYHEGYIRYDIVKSIKAPFSLQFQGFHRRRYQPQTFADPWLEGENYTALQWSPHWSFVFGYEYLARKACRPDTPDESFCNFFNGGITYRAGNTDTVLGQILNTVNVFVGQRRGAIRCVSGVCRLFPPFEGARIELVSRF